MVETKGWGRNAPADVRFDRLVMPEPNSGCHLWLGVIDKGPRGGYGQFWNGKCTRAHIFAYVRQYGPVPEGLEIDHKCRVRSCVNPDHLRVVTRRENVLCSTSPAAVYARSTRCKKGHELSAENTLTERGRNGRTQRRCRTCRCEEQARNKRKAECRRKM